MSKTLTREPEGYGRGYSILDTYVDDGAYMLAKMYNVTIEVATDFIKSTIGENGSHPAKEAKAKWLRRQENGDRVKVVGTVTSYLAMATKNNYIMSPSMALYLPPEQKKSLYADLMEFNTARRSKSKHEKFEAEVAGDEELAEYKQVEQTTFKIKNNSLSGAHASAFTMLYNKSAHSTLTSTCRAMTTTNNAHAERFLAGNRHYFNPSVALSNIVSVIRRSNLEDVAMVVEKYNLKCPTVEDVYYIVERSCGLYFKSDEGMSKIRQLIEGLSDIERAAYLFTSDLFSMAMVNPKFVEEMLDALSAKITEGDDYDTSINPGKMDEETAMLMGSIFREEVTGSSVAKLMKANDPSVDDMRRTLDNLYKTTDYYMDYFRVLLASDSPPAVIGEFTTSIRRVVPVSDTDSTVYSVAKFVKDRFGFYDFTTRARAYGAAVAFLSNRLTAHWLAMLSRQGGIGGKLMNRLTMKPEFGFPVIFMTGKAKHYCMRIDSCEGVFYKDMKLDLKGVSFRSSKIPKVIRDGTVKMIESVMDDVEQQIPIDGFKILTETADVEREIRASVVRGDTQYLSTAQVREKETYANPESSPFAFKEFWDTVFGPKYGMAPPPPYQAVKVSLDLATKIKVKEWKDKLEDSALVERYGNYLTTKGKKQGTYFLVPLEVVKVSGIPSELIEAMDIRKLILGLMESRYLALESLGCYESTPKKTKLISDTY